MKPMTTRVYTTGNPVPIKIIRNRAAQARAEMTPQLRAAIIKRDGGLCRYCTTKPVSLEIDHIYPVTRGGESSMSNCVVACHGCNERKGWSATWVPIPLDKMPEVVAGRLKSQKQPTKHAMERIRIREEKRAARREALRTDLESRYGDDRIHRYSGRKTRQTVGAS